MTLRLHLNNHKSEQSTQSDQLWLTFLLCARDYDLKSKFAIDC